jgi:hypothetical protein
MNYFSANTVSGRIQWWMEGLDDSNIHEYGDRYHSNNEVYICRVESGTVLTPSQKWWNHEAGTSVDKTEISLTYSHAAVEQDFFSDYACPTIEDPLDPTSPVTIGRVDDPDEPTLVLFNDVDVITVVANTSVTISSIPNDGDTDIIVNGQTVDFAESITVIAPTNVEIDSPKYFRKIIEVIT